MRGMPKRDVAKRWSIFVRQPGQGDAPLVLVVHRLLAEPAGDVVGRPLRDRRHVLQAQRLLLTQAAMKARAAARGSVVSGQRWPSSMGATGTGGPTES
jgi:hypothetical protein